MVLFIFQIDRGDKGNITGIHGSVVVWCCHLSIMFVSYAVACRVQINKMFKIRIELKFLNFANRVDRNVGIYCRHYTCILQRCMYCILKVNFIIYSC